jgi:hypothetical protein
MPDSYDPNELLGVAPGASEDDIRKAFRRRAKIVHPDVSDAPDAAEQFIRLQAAHDLLIDRLTLPDTPAPESLYRTAQPVDEEKQEQIIQSFRRRREAEARRRSRRRSAVKGQARRAQRENDAFQEEMARRRAEFEASQREELQRERDERLQAEREERERAAADAEARQRMEEVRRRTLDELERAKRERSERDREDREARDRERRARRASRMKDEPLECAWKDCHEADELALPLETALGPRRFCHQHYDEYLEFRRGKRRQTASARNRA